MRPMKIRVEDANLVDELVRHLRRSGCFAAPSDVQAHGAGVMIDVSLPAALDSEQARMELELYLKVFEATHPRDRVELLT
jgi:hypothetical protein